MIDFLVEGYVAEIYLAPPEEVPHLLGVKMAGGRSQPCRETVGFMIRDGGSNVSNLPPPRGGGRKREGQSITTGEPPRKTVSNPPPSARYVLSPSGLSFVQSFRHSQKFPQVTSSETAYGGPSSRGFAFQYVLPTLSSAQTTPHTTYNPCNRVQVLKVIDLRPASGRTDSLQTSLCEAA